MFSVKGLKKEDLVYVAKELGQKVEEQHTIADLKALIESSSSYEKDVEFVKEFIVSTVNDRLEKQKRDIELSKIEQERSKEEQNTLLELEKTKLELMKAQLEIAKVKAEGGSPNSGGDGLSGNSNSLEALIKSVKTLALAVPNKPESWNLFFSSLEKAFELKNVAKDLKVEILLNLLGERAANLLVYVDAEEMKDYQKVKTIILKEFQPTPEACLDNFLSAKRAKNENHMQFASRLRANWDFYCELRKATDIETLNELIVSDRLLDALDSETRSYIRIKQLDTWLKPKEIAERCDNWFTSKGRSFSELYDKQTKFRNQSETGFGNQISGKYVPPHMRNNYSERNINSKECKLCKRVNHMRFCPNNREKNKTGISQTQTKKNSAAGKDDKLIAKVKTAYFDDDVIDTQPLQYVYIWLGGKQIKALIDSAAEMPIINSNQIPETFENVDYSKIQLISAFGDKIVADLKTLPISLKQNTDNFSSCNVDILFSITNKLVVPCIITPVIYDLLKSALEKEGGSFDDLITQEGNKQELCENEMLRGKSIETEKVKGGGACESLFTQSGEKELMISCVKNGNELENEMNVGQLSDVSIFRKEQKSCETLREAFRDAENNKNGYFIMDYLLYHKEKVSGENICQLVVPKVRREQILKLAHESIFANHLGMRKSKERIRYSFYWPNMSRDIEQYCKSCKECQLRSRERASDQIPITPIQRPEFAFQQVTMDIIGPIETPSARRHKYVLCLVDQHSRWPEAVPLRTITAKATCDALLEIFMRTGIPSVIASDQGTNFVSKLTQEFHARLGATPRFATPGHPQSSGLVERYNQVLKRMLHHIIRSDPKNWDKHIPYMLFAYREIPNSTTGVSPFKLLYGREARGPLAVLKSSWAGEIPLPINIGKSAVEYLQELKVNLEKAAEEASLIAEVKQGAYARYANRRAVYKEFSPGDQVYLLIPDSNNKLYARWTGPAEIVARCSTDSYKVKLASGNIKTVHVNKIRKFIPRVQAVGVIFENEQELGEVHPTPSRNDKSNSFNLSEVNLSHLDEFRRKDIEDLLTKYKSLFLNKVQIAKVGEHKIRLTETERKKPYIYRIPESLKSQVDKQVDELLSLGLIEECDSEISYPVVCVMKKDGALRLCVDFRSLNIVTKPDDFPMENQTELLFCIGKANVISTIDLLKGYWAIPMERESQDLACFKTHRAQYRFKVMPFGLRNAAATFQRVMNQALAKYRDFSRAYIDDIAVYSATFEEHLVHLDSIFTKLSELNFSVNLKKCSFAKSHIKYLGHIIGSGGHQTDPEKVEAIQKLARPHTKKQLKTFLGLCNYYRDYVPHYAEIAYCLTELTKKKAPEDLTWTQEHEEAFHKLKKCLAEAPNLSTPIIGQTFVIQCDASSIGIGACLSQKKEGALRPVSYASQKLTKAQQAWPTIEREAYAVIWSLKKFETWIFGSPVELVTDHNPLTFITKNAPQSSKLQRWALALQKYNISITHCPGAKLVNADALSRLETVDACSNIN